MSGDNYPRVKAGVTAWEPFASGPYKVVVAGAIVIERSDLPEVHVEGERVRAGASTWPLRVAAPKPADLREDALELLAIAEYLDAHPPVDEQQVKALADDLIGRDAEDVSYLDRDDALKYARRLVEQGWSKGGAR